MPLLYLYLILTLIVALMAAVRGRSAWRWFLIALFISPLIGGLLVMVLPRQPNTQPVEREPVVPGPPIVPMATDSTIRIVRRAGHSGRARPFELFINGARVARIERMGVVDIPVPSGSLVVEARTELLASRPVQIEAAPGQRVDIEFSDRGGALGAASEVLLGAGKNLKLRQLPPASVRRAA
jgi:hypothetical protein